MSREVSMQYGRAIGNSANGSGKKIVLLWENSDITASFSAQTVSIDLSNYDALLVVLTQSSSNDIRFTSIMLVDGTQYGLFGKTNATYNYSRFATADSTGVTFTTGCRTTTSGDAYAIPVSIYGIKF